MLFHIKGLVVFWVDRRHHVDRLATTTSVVALWLVTAHISFDNSLVDTFYDGPTTSFGAT